MKEARRLESCVAFRVVTVAAIFWCSTVATLAGESASESYILESSTMAMQSVSASSETYAMNATVGQPIASGLMSGGLYTADVGFLNDLDADNDGILGSFDLCPSEFGGCNDANGDGCIDMPDTDADADGVGRGECDCDDGNGQIWGRPGEVRNVRFTSGTAFAWDSPIEPGATLPRYDVIRSLSARDLVSAATCVESDDAADTAATDAGAPAVGSTFYYLVRAEDSCASGAGPLGVSRSFLARTARSCP